MSRPPFKVTEQNRNTVKALAGYGLKHEQIVSVLGIRSTKTLRKHFRHELDAGGAEADAQVAQTMFKMATSGNHPAATIFWLKTRASWSEKAADSARPIPTPTLIISQEGHNDSREN
jgi:hypothetical protein